MAETSPRDSPTVEVDGAVGTLTTPPSLELRTDGKGAAVWSRKSVRNLISTSARSRRRLRTTLTLENDLHEKEFEALEQMDAESKLCCRL